MAHNVAQWGRTGGKRVIPAGEETTQFGQPHEEPRVRRILVPVDGSARSEQVLPAAALVAKAQLATIMLVRVLEPLIWPIWQEAWCVPPQQYDDLLGGIRGYAAAGLARAEARLRAAGVTVTPILLDGLPATTLLDFEASHTPELCVLAAPGNDGFLRRLLGTLDDRLVSSGATPVLLLPPHSCGEPHLARALVPLDGSSDAESALPVVHILAQKPLAHVRLLMALGDSAGRSIAESAQGRYVGTTSYATAYLEAIAAQLMCRGLTVEIVLSAERSPVAIPRAAAGMDLVIASAPRRSALRGLRCRRSADRVARRLPIPRLLVPGGQSGASDRGRSAGDSF